MSPAEVLAWYGGLSGLLTAAGLAWIRREYRDEDYPDPHEPTIAESENDA